MTLRYTETHCDEQASWTEIEWAEVEWAKAHPETDAALKAAATRIVTIDPPSKSRARFGEGIVVDEAWGPYRRGKRR